jgi:hypothetical protein
MSVSSSGTGPAPQLNVNPLAVDAVGNVWLCVTIRLSSDSATPAWAAHAVVVQNRWRRPW